MDGLSRKESSAILAVWDRLNACKGLIELLMKECLTAKSYLPPVEALKFMKDFVSEAHCVTEDLIKKHPSLCSIECNIVRVEKDKKDDPPPSQLTT